MFNKYLLKTASVTFLLFSDVDVKSFQKICLFVTNRSEVVRGETRFVCQLQEFIFIRGSLNSRV